MKERRGIACKCTWQTFSLKHVAYFSTHSFATLISQAYLITRSLSHSLSLFPCFSTQALLLILTHSICLRFSWFLSFIHSCQIKISKVIWAFGHLVTLNKATSFVYIKLQLKARKRQCKGDSERSMSTKRKKIVSFCYLLLKTVKILLFSHFPRIYEIDKHSLFFYSLLFYFL